MPLSLPHSTASVHNEVVILPDSHKNTDTVRDIKNYTTMCLTGKTSSISKYKTAKSQQAHLDCLFYTTSQHFCTLEAQAIFEEYKIL